MISFKVLTKVTFIQDQIITFSFAKKELKCGKTLSANFGKSKLNKYTHRPGITRENTKAMAPGLDLRATLTVSHRL